MGLQDPSIAASPGAALATTAPISPAALMPKAVPLAQIQHDKENAKPEMNPQFQTTTIKKSPSSAASAAQKPQKRRSAKENQENRENLNLGNVPHEQIQKNN